MFGFECTNMGADIKTSFSIWKASWASWDQWNLAGLCRMSITETATWEKLGMKWRQKIVNAINLWISWMLHGSAKACRAEPPPLTRLNLGILWRPSQTHISWALYRAHVDIATVKLFGHGGHTWFGPLNKSECHPDKLWCKIPEGPGAVIDKMFECVRSVGKTKGYDMPKASSKNCPWFISFPDLNQVVRSSWT